MAGTGGEGGGERLQELQRTRTRMVGTQSGGREQYWRRSDGGREGMAAARPRRTSLQRSGDIGITAVELAADGSCGLCAVGDGGQESGSSLRARIGFRRRRATVPCEAMTTRAKRP
ncbi:hypothetical protein Syun_028172 [Stephania yunnanensis]|uniref:Uncharacterized protein n=1 Tax=Stephania yunnanensis TaxID=152371 RepID=A0AAP0EGV1_9MAGN